MLQRRGTVTAAEAAEELEISIRTARRDFEALSASGVPVYSQSGRGGGWRLLGGGSTDLSGLTASEARALFVAAGRSLDAHPNLRSALRKLAAALPEPFQSDAESAACAFTGPAVMSETRSAKSGVRTLKNNDSSCGGSDGRIPNTPEPEIGVRHRPEA